MKKLILTCLGALALTLAGCQTAVNSNPQQITIEPAVRQYISTDPLTIRVNESGVTEAKFVVRSMDKKKLQAYQYNVQWTDAKGFPVNTVTGSWSHFSLPPLGQETIGIVGPTPEAANFQIYIQGVKK